MILEAETTVQKSANGASFYAPTLEQIAEECRKIRATSTRDEWVKRRVSMPSELDREYEPCNETTSTRDQSSTTSSNVLFVDADHPIVLSQAHDGRSDGTSVDDAGTRSSLSNVS